MSASSFVPAGRLLHAIGGEMFLPSAVYSTGIGCACLSTELVTVIAAGVCAVAGSVAVMIQPIARAVVTPDRIDISLEFANVSGTNGPRPRVFCVAGLSGARLLELRRFQDCRCN